VADLSAILVGLELKAVGEERIWLILGYLGCR